MLSAAEKHQAFTEALIIALRVASEGGSSVVQLPNDVTGEMEPLYLDQAAASEFVIELLDALAERALSDPTIPLIEREPLAVWRAAPQRKH